MFIESNGDTLCVSQVGNLCSYEAESFRNQVLPALPAAPCVVEVDFSRTQIVDSAGLAVLRAFFTAASKHDLRIVNPTKGVKDMLRLGNLDKCFEYIHR
jgi:anti-anti-sigma factor